jgi:hypothetical protein
MGKMGLYLASDVPVSAARPGEGKVGNMFGERTGSDGVR